MIDEVTRTPYFLGIVTIDLAGLPPDVARNLRPGMPAEVLVPAGERSVMSYLTDPLSRGLRKTFTEK